MNIYYKNFQNQIILNLIGNMITSNKSFDIFLKICTFEDKKFAKFFITRFVVANHYSHNLVSFEKLKELKTVKNIEQFIFMNFTIKEIFLAIESEEDKNYVINFLSNFLFK